MPVTRNLRSSLGENNGQSAPSSVAADLPLAKTREVRQAAMGSPYAPASSPKTKAATATAAPSRSQFGALVPNGLPDGVRGKFARTESMPILSRTESGRTTPSSSDESELASSPISTRTRTASKQASATSSSPSVEQGEQLTDQTSASPSQRRRSAVKRSAAESNSTSSSSSSTSSGQNGTPTSRRGEDPTPRDDDDEEDDPRQRRRRSSRLGGCSSQSDPRRERDDSNKENIAPLNYRSALDARSVSGESVDENGAVVQLGMRTRMMTRRTVSSPVIHFSGSASNTSGGSMTASSHPRRSARRSGLARTECFGTGRLSDPTSLSIIAPTTPSRRMRGAPLSPAINDASGPASPFARLNLGLGASALGTAPSISTNASLADDAESSYFSSQGSASVAPSIFDSASQFAEEDFEMDDLSLIMGPHGHLPGSRRSRAFGVEGSQDSSIYSRASSVMPDMDVLTEDGEGAQEHKSAAAIGSSSSDDVEMQDVEDKNDSAETKMSNAVRYPNVYAHARNLLRYSTDGEAKSSDGEANTTGPAGEHDVRTEVEIVGRDEEREAITTFLSAHFGAKTLAASKTSKKETSTKAQAISVDVSAPSLYICGLPGTGKTALVRSVMADLRRQPRRSTVAPTEPRMAFVNCMSITSPRQIFGRILQQLGEADAVKADPFDIESESNLEQVLRKTERHILIVLDEIDHLLEKRAHQSVLQRLFCIGKSTAVKANKRAKCALIGIANSLDLTERFMPLLVQTEMAPTVLHMRPYTAADIVKVVRNRLTGLYARYDYAADETSEPALNTEEAIFKKAALDLAGKKIAAATGDLRKALDVCRLAVELVEAEQRQGAINVMTTEATANDVVAAELLSPLTVETAPRVMPQHILRVLNSVLGNAQVSRVRQLGMHAKFLLLALLVAQRRNAEGLQVLGCAVHDKLARAVGGGASSASGVRFSEVQMTYSKMLRNDGHFAPVETSELLQIVDALEVEGILAQSNEMGTGSSSSSSSHAASMPGSGPSGIGKRAAKKSQLAANRILSLVLPVEDVQDGITTAQPALASSSSSSNTSSSSHAADEHGAGSSPAAIAVVAEVISRMWRHEETRIVRSRGWEAAALESEAVRREELGGGRGYQPLGL